jgi:hypothetical protein
MRALVGGIIGRGGAGAAHRDPGALATEGLRDAVADAARAADHQNLLAAEIELVHAVTFFLHLCSADRFQRPGNR